MSRPASHVKRVIVAGGGIAGLCCAYELTRRGHDVTVLEAAARPGGHVRTMHDPFADGLYADIGAEHFYKPGYDHYWPYLEEFKLPIVRYPRRENMLRLIEGRAYSEAQLQSRPVLTALGFNAREIDYLAERPWWELPMLYFAPLIARFKHQDQPFDAGLNELDWLSLTQFLVREGASAAAISFFGGSGSALQSIWQAAIKAIRGTPLLTRDLYRIQGGNQRMTDAFAVRLGERVKLSCPVAAIEHGPTHVRVHYRQFGEAQTIDGDFLVLTLSAVMLRQIPVTPPWPQEKAFALRNMPYYTQTRIVFQARNRFWAPHSLTPNIEFGAPHLSDAWRMADEVQTERAILIGSAPAGVEPQEALAAFRKLYPGGSDTIEQAFTYDWGADPWAMACERVSYMPGQLHRFWPEVTRPVGRIHFAGAYCSNMTWGQEAATESANRAARAIEAA